MEITRLIFWVSLMVIAYTYAGYPALCVACGRIFRKRFKQCEYYPRVSVLVACYNEQRVIRQKIENLLSLEYPKDKIQIMIASESDDQTNTIIREYLPCGIKLFEYQQRRGKTVMLYETVPHATGEILVFSDANVMLKKDALAQLTSYFCDERVGAVTARLVVTNPRTSDISWGEYIYKQYETFLRRANGRIGAVLNPDGALFAIRKSLYVPLSRQRGDDFELVIRILIEGHASVFAQEAISLEDASVTTAAEISRKIRMVSWFTISTLLLLAEMARKGKIRLMVQLVSHKLLRWLTPYFFTAFFAASMVLANEGWFFLVLFAAQVIGYGMGLVGWYIAEKTKKTPPFLLKAAHYFLMYNYAFLIGTIRGILPGKASSAWGKVRA